MAAAVLSAATATSRAASIRWCKANYLASPPLVVAYALAGTVDDRPDDRAAGHGPRRPAGLPEGHLADPGRDRGRRRAVDLAARCSALATPTCFEGQRDVETRSPGVGGRAVSPGTPPAPTSRSRRSSSSFGPTPRAARPTPRRARAGGLGDSVTTDHISPGGRSPRTARPASILQEQRRRAGRLQQLRLAARQRPRDDARHVRQHPHPQPAGAGHRGRRDPAPARRRADDDLRRRR